MEPTIVKGSDIIGSSAKKDAEVKVKKYDFKRPDKFSKDQIRTIAVLHETFSRLATTSLSSSLRMFCELHLASVDQMTYEEFIRSIPSPTAMGLVNMRPLKGAMVLEIDPPLIFAMVDRLFGGTGAALETKREITGLEHIILENIFTRILLGDFKESWSHVIDLNPTLEQIDTNPQFAQIVPPTEMIVLATAEAKVGDVKGMINLCYPYLTIEPIIGKLTARYWYSSVRRGKLDWNEAADVGSLAAETELYFEGEDLSLRELGRLKKKSLIKLPDFKKGRAFLTAGGAPVLDLRREDKKPGYRFSVEGDRSITERERTFLELSGRVKKTTEREEMEKLVSSPLDVISSEIRKSMEELKAGIGEINSRQEEIVDQMYFSTPDREVPQEGTPEAGRGKPFGFVRMTDWDNLFNIIGREHPQLIALVTAYLDTHIASHILSSFPEDRQIDIANRIASLDRTDPRILETVERWVQEKLKAMGLREATPVGGIEQVVDILNVSSRSVEKTVVEGLEKQNPGLAEDIKKRMFVFEDIVLLDNEAIQKVIRKADREALLIALKAVDQEVSDRIYGNMPKDAAAAFKSDYEKIGRVRLTDVEAAQQGVVSLIRKLEEEGEIVVAHPDEMVVE